MVDLTRSSLIKMGIFELRGVGRELGVKSPTTKKKEDIIEEILAIVEGKKNPYVRPNAKGRPPLASSKFGYSSSSTPDYSLWDFPQTPELRVASSDTDNCVKHGMVVVTTKGFGFVQENFNVDSKLDAYLETTFIKRYNLKSGDVVDVMVKEVPPKYISTVVEVLKVNGIVASRVTGERREYKIIKAHQQLGTLNQTPIYKGQRVLIENLDIEEVVNFFNSLKSQKFLVNANSLPEEFIDEAINVSCFDKPSTRYRTVDLVLNRALRMAEVGEDVVVYVADIAFLPLAFMEYSADKINDNTYTNEAILKLREMLSCGRKIDGRGSVTLICGINKNVANADLTVSNIKAVFNVVI